MSVNIRSIPLTSVINSGVFGEIPIGRASATGRGSRVQAVNNLYLPDRTVSKHHCTIDVSVEYGNCDEYGVLLRTLMLSVSDCDSHHGTVVHDSLVKPGSWITIEEGDLIGLVTVSKVATSTDSKIEDITIPVTSCKFLIQYLGYDNDNLNFKVLTKEEIFELKAEKKMSDEITIDDDDDVADEDLDGSSSAYDEESYGLSPSVSDVDEDLSVSIEKTTVVDIDEEISDMEKEIDEQAKIADGDTFDNSVSIGEEETFEVTGDDEDVNDYPDEMIYPESEYAPQDVPDVAVANADSTVPITPEDDTVESMSNPVAINMDAEEETLYVIETPTPADISRPEFETTKILSDLKDQPKKNTRAKPKRAGRFKVRKNKIKKSVKKELFTGLVGFAVGMTMGAGLTFSTLAAYGKSLV